MKPEKTECFNCRSEGIIRRVSLEDVWFRNRTWKAWLTGKLIGHCKVCGQTWAVKIIKGTIDIQ